MLASTLLAQRQVVIASLIASGLTFAVMFVPLVPAASQVLGPNTASALDTSRNWSGYAATNGTFTTVAGTWTVPRLSSNTPASADATWVGIGGVRGRDLIQGGTMNIVTSSGAISTTAFIEMLPRALQRISLPVNSGDSVTVSITQQTAHRWQISIVNTTNGQSFSTSVAYHSSLSSAEWIEEDPEIGGRLRVLDNFGTVEFSGATTTKNGSVTTMAQANGQAITLINNSCQALATASVLGSDGASFSVTRSITDTNPVSQPGNEEGRWRGESQACLTGGPAPATVPPPAPSYIPIPFQNFWGGWSPFLRRWGRR